MEAAFSVLQKKSPWIQQLPGTRSFHSLSRLIDIDIFAKKYSGHWEDDDYWVDMHFFDAYGTSISTIANLTPFQVNASPFMEDCGLGCLQAHFVAYQLARYNERNNVRYLVCFYFKLGSITKRTYQHCSLFRIAPSVTTDQLLIEFGKCLTPCPCKSMADVLELLDIDSPEAIESAAVQYYKNIEDYRELVEMIETLSQLRARFQGAG